MNPTIRPTKVLDYYDGVLVFIAEGDDDQQYVGSIIDTTDGIDRYLVKATTPGRIKDLKRGRVDLRSLLLESPVNDWFLAFDGNAPDQPLELHPQRGSIETTDFLPSEGYFLDNQDAEAHERLIEKWLPINEVSIEAVREGGALAGHPPVNQLHVWWARRPLIASRATVAASLLPIDADRSRLSPTLELLPKWSPLAAKWTPSKQRVAGQTYPSQTTGPSSTTQISCPMTPPRPL